MLRLDWKYAARGYADSCLADVDDLSVGIFVKIDAGRCGKHLELFGDRHKKILP